MRTSWRIGGLSSLYGQVIQPLRAVQDEYAEIVRREKPESYRRKLLSLVTRNSPSLLTIYNQVEILHDVTEKYPRLLEDVRNAKSSIHLLYFIWSEDEFTVQLKDALIERAKAGVKVRALADASGLNVSKEYLQALQDAAQLPSTRYSDYRLHSSNYRSHRKIVVIDGKIGYVGGLNLDKEQLPGGNRLGSWRDTHLEDRGEAVLALQASLPSTGITRPGKIRCRDLFPQSGYQPACDHSCADYTGRPDSQWKAMQQLYFFMIMTAERKVQIQSPFFVPDESLLEAIKAGPVGSSGGDHGVQARYGTRAGSPRSFTYLADVVRSGAKVYLYNKGYFHSKTINIDSQVCAIGTANFDIRSFSINYEAMAVLYDKDLAVELAADFENDLKSCEEFSSRCISLPTLAPPAELYCPASLPDFVSTGSRQI